MRCVDNIFFDSRNISPSVPKLQRKEMKVCHLETCLVVVGTRSQSILQYLFSEITKILFNSLISFSLLHSVSLSLFSLFSTQTRYSCLLPKISQWKGKGIFLCFPFPPPHVMTRKPRKSGWQPSTFAQVKISSSACASLK